ncbi:MAG: ParB N-terminal domain-containing protein [Pseudarthrobacter sp.]|nr:ParB N-terminal domain-containing protein [Pseudarthrobacter sp.]
MTSAGRIWTPERVSYYVDHFDESTPVVVFDVDGILLLVDGQHRVAAAERLGRAKVRADVRKGQRRDALQFAVNLGKQQRGMTKEHILQTIARREQRLQ